MAHPDSGRLELRQPRAEIVATAEPLSNVRWLSDDQPCMLHATSVLVSVEGSDFRAGIRKDARSQLWLAVWKPDEPDRVAGSSIEGSEATRIGLDGWTAVGG